MNQPPFVSYAQNAEDVVLWRALNGVVEGVYVDVGANHPRVESVTKAFYDRGWWGLNVEPVAEFAEALRSERSRDIVVEAAVATRDREQVVLHEFEGTGLSTLRGEYVPSHVEQGHAVRERRIEGRRLDSLVAEHLEGVEVHFCKIDVEGAEAQVLASVDLRTWRPWVLIVEATRPLSTEPMHHEWEPAVLAAGYQLCLFDGVSRFYVADEHADRLRPALSFPACSLDVHTRIAMKDLQRDVELARGHHAMLEAERDALQGRTEQVDDLEREVARLRADLVRWRGVVLERWSAALVGTGTSTWDDAARAELVAMRRTVSWRVTRPLRAVRERQRRVSA